MQPDGAFQGYYVAMTSLRSPNGIATDPETYVDATRFPYVVIPTGFGALPHVAKPGDVGFATHIPSGITTTRNWGKGRLLFLCRSEDKVRIQELDREFLQGRFNTLFFLDRDGRARGFGLEQTTTFTTKPCS